MEFYRDKKKSLNLILICALILVALAGAFLYGIGFFDGHVSNKLAAATGLSSLILAIVIISKLLKLRDTSPLVILSNEGLVSKTTAVGKAAGLILWEDISDVNLEKVGADTLVTLAIDKPESYLPLVKKKLSGMVTDGMADPSGQIAISLTASELTVDAQELFNAITVFKNKSK